MRVALTPKQVKAIELRIFPDTTTIEVDRWKPTGQMIEVSQFAGVRLIETVKIGPSGGVTVLS